MGDAQLTRIGTDVKGRAAYTHVLIAERPPGMALPQPVPAYLLSAYSTPTPSSIIQPRSTQ